VDTSATAAQRKLVATRVERMLGQLVAHGTAEEKRHINYPVQGEIMMQGACGLRVFCRASSKYKATQNPGMRS